MFNEIILPVLLFLVGIVLIVKGGDFFVDAAAWIAEISGIPKLVIGATIVSVATTLPEILVSTMAAAQGNVDIAVGNAVGSVTANIGLIMAISLLFLPSVIKRKDYLLKSILLIGAAISLVVGALIGEVNLPISLVLMVIFIVFIIENVKSAKKSESHPIEGVEGEPAQKTKPNAKTIVINILKFIGGAVGIVVGANLLVNNGSAIALYIGIPERIIAVTLVAVGTSLPELITTITAIAKKHASLSVGNVIGANIIDLTLILPLSALISGQALPVFAAGGSHAAAILDISMCLLTGIIALVPALISGKFRRWQGVALLAVYISYIVITCTCF